MRSTSVKSFVIALVLLSTLATSATAAPREEPRDKQESVILRLQKIAKTFFQRLAPLESISIPKP
jgi:hypothetical protein